MSTRIPTEKHSDPLDLLALLSVESPCFWKLHNLIPTEIFTTYHVLHLADTAGKQQSRALRLKGN